MILIAGTLAVNFILSEKPYLIAARGEEKALGGPVTPSIKEPQIERDGALGVENYTIETEHASTTEFMETDIVLIEGSAIVNTSSNPRTTSSKTTNNKASRGYFIAPTTGWNWGKIHDYNAVDIANICGTPVHAAAEGLVIESKTEGWNDGYGSYIEIEHPNTMKTRYAHLSKNTAQLGQYITQGDLIGQIGNTGNTHGPTGCHLHFEVRGGKNPLGKE